MSLIDDIYELKLEGGVVETYNSDGWLLSILQNGMLTSLDYGVQTITVMRNGYELTLTVDDGRVLQVADSSSVLATYHYSEFKEFERLDSVGYPGGSTLNYLYEDLRFPGHVTGIIDENGQRISSVQYDENARVTSSEKGPMNSGIERTQISYDDVYVRTLTNSLGKQTTYHFTQLKGEYKITHVEGHASENCAAANKSYTYYLSGNVETETDWNGNVTHYTYDDRGRELIRTEGYRTADSRKTITEWHPQFNLPTLIVEPHREIVLEYDEHGKLTSREVIPKSP